MVEHRLSVTFHGEPIHYCSVRVAGYAVWVDRLKRVKRVRSGRRGAEQDEQRPTAEAGLRRQLFRSRLIAYPLEFDGIRHMSPFDTGLHASEEPIVAVRII